MILLQDPAFSFGFVCLVILYVLVIIGASIFVGDKNVWIINIFALQAVAVVAATWYFSNLDGALFAFLGESLLLGVIYLAIGVYLYRHRHDEVEEISHSV